MTRYDLIIDYIMPMRKTDHHYYPTDRNEYDWYGYLTQVLMPKMTAQDQQNVLYAMRRLTSKVDKMGDQGAAELLIKMAANPEVCKLMEVK